MRWGTTGGTDAKDVRDRHILQREAGYMEHDERRMRFVAAAYELFEERGISKTSIVDIANRVGVARSLFYHYFPNKNAITGAVISYRVDTFIERLKEWTRMQRGQDTYTSLVGVVGIIRSFLQGSNTLSGAVKREEDAMLFQRFAFESAACLADHFARTQNVKGSLVSISNVRHPRETFYTLSIGVISLLSREPEVSDEVIADVVVDTLHIDLSTSAAKWDHSAE